MWTAERILALAPDPASAKAGQGLSSPRKWVSSGHSQRAIWGECQGSGAKPYQTQIDLLEPAFKCSCPSRKFPCKHALGLFLMLGAVAGAGTDAPPTWVADWLGSREEKAAKKIEKASDAPADPAAQAKRAAERMKKITDGAADLELWLEDVVRQGLAAAQNAGDAYWQQPAARMVDAQAPGLARMIREMGDTLSSGEGWQQRALARLGRIFLLVQAFKRLTQLPLDLQADVRNLVGIPVREEELLPLPPVRDTWSVVGQFTHEEEKLRTQRSWLCGENTGRHALILEFAYGGQPLKSTLVLGTAFTGDLIFYPGAFPLRAIVKEHAGNIAEIKRLTGMKTISAALNAYSESLALNPFMDPYPLMLSDVRPLCNEQATVADSQGNTLELSPRPGHGWRMVAISGGHPITLFGEFDGRTLTPFSMLAGETLHALI